MAREKSGKGSGGKSGRGGKVERDRDKYDKAGKGKDPKGLRDIPTKTLRDYMKSDKDAFRAGQAKLELDRREKERAKQERDRAKRERDRARKEKGRRSGGAADRR